MKAELCPTCSADLGTTVRHVEGAHVRYLPGIVLSDKAMRAMHDRVRKQVPKGEHEADS